MTLAFKGGNGFVIYAGDRFRRDKAGGCELKTEGQYGKKEYESFELPSLKHVQTNDDHDQNEAHDESKDGSHRVHWSQKDNTHRAPSSSCRTESTFHDERTTSFSSSSRSSSVSASSLGDPTYTDSASSLTTLFPHQLDSSGKNELPDKSATGNYGLYDTLPWIASSFAERDQLREGMYASLAG